MLCGKKCILHQRNDCHRSDTSGNRGNVRAKRCNRIEVDVAFESESALCFCRRNTCRAHVDNHCARFYHVGGDESGTAQGGNDYVGAKKIIFDILCAAMTSGDCCIDRLGLLLRNWLLACALDEASAKHHAVCTAGVYVVAAKQFDDSLWCCRHEAG